MPLQATSGAASYDAFGGGVAAEPNYIESVFSTYLYAGTGATQTITNGIDLSGKGGLVWLKSRTGAYNNYLTTDATGLSTLGGTQWMYSNTTDALIGAVGNGLTAFNSNGFDIRATGVAVNATGNNYASWTFRKQPKCFDVVTFSGNGTTNNIAHNLGSVPGCIFVKRTDSAQDWAVYHRGDGSSQVTSLSLNFFVSAGFVGSISGITSTTFNANAISDYNGVSGNQSGGTYVAYLFAHDAGGFGLTGTDNVISCGSYTGNGSSTGPVVTLGYEPQWLLIKKVTGGNSQWTIFDNMRGFSVTADNILQASTSNAESPVTPPYASPNATGFYISNSNGQVNDSGSTYIYIAIRRGPMKVPTSGTSVFAPVTATPSGATTVTTNFPVDLAINAQRDSATSGNKVFWDRLRGSSTAAGQGLFSNLTNAEVSYSGNGIGLQSNTTIVDNFWNTLNGATTPVIYWNLRRAPGFFDEVCWTGTSVAHNENHNLGVAPTLLITKTRSTSSTTWWVYNNFTGTGYDRLELNSDVASTTYTWAVNGGFTAAPTATTLPLSTGTALNASGRTYVAYLFATCAGVSKVGSYTGNGSTQTINCGFTGGARFVLIKNTSSGGDWYVYDTARGMTTLTDPYVLLNSNAAEVATLGSVTTVTTGFALNSSILADINTNSQTYIYLAIA